MKATELVVLSTFRSLTDAQIANGFWMRWRLHPPSARTTLAACIPPSIRLLCW
jgi:hypothetical protein